MQNLSGSVHKRTIYVRRDKKGSEMRLRCGHPARRVRPGAGVRRRSGEKLEIFGAYRRNAGAGHTFGATWVPKCLTI
jgi:hypothetical protein